MAIIITTDIERAARRTDRTLTIRQGDIVGPEARALAERLGVRIVGPDAPPPAPSLASQPASSPPPPPSTETGSLPNVPPIRREPEDVPLEGASAAPMPNPADILARLSTTSQPAAPSSLAPLPLEGASAAPMPNPADILARLSTSPQPTVAPSPNERDGAGQVGQAPPPPTTPPVGSPTEFPLPVRRIPIATPIAAEPERVTPPISRADAGPRPQPTLVSSRRPPSYRQRRQIARGSAPSTQLGVILGRVIDSQDVRRAAEARVRLVRIGPEAYVTRSARHVAAQLGVVLYPDSNLLDVDDRTKAGRVLNPISREPAITRHGAGIMHPGGIPIGGDHLPGTLGVEEAK
ncbi:MAG: hypothetical protein KatS3mg060_1290 [Dehalococcoidia bacterium]|nr:MAG: hypothetical protein KatS3mg060_1290 [Dehalococcoidia bacterium]